MVQAVRIKCRYFRYFFKDPFDGMVRLKQKYEDLLWESKKVHRGLVGLLEGENVG